jgi:hypothetical protein
MWIVTDVSEKPAPYCRPTLKMKVGSSFETLIMIYQTAWRHVTEDTTLQNCPRENLKSYNNYFAILIRSTVRIVLTPSYIFNKP